MSDNKPGAAPRAFISAMIHADDTPGLVYKGNRRDLTTLFRHIRDQLREREHIGNHPRLHAARSRDKE